MRCYLCGSDSKRVFNRVDSFGFPLIYYQCDQCGLVYQLLEESQAADPEFYSETYRKIYQDHVEPTAKDIYVQEKRAPFLIQWIKNYLPHPPKRVLDIGASTGILLEAFRNAFQCEVVGVEPGDAYRAYAEGKGIRMAPALDDLIGEHPGQFDLVSMIHVIEHLPDPVGTLKLIRENLLTSNGLILVEAPNFYAHDSYELAHLTCFTPHTLVEVLRQAGFRVQSLRRHGSPRSTLLNLYVTAVAQPAGDSPLLPPIRPDRLVPQRRQVGLLYRRFVQRLFPHKAWLPLPGEKIG